MNRRRVLRRRLVAVILVLLAIGMLTLYFRETDVGVAHRVQDGASSVVAPLQYGTARATKPFRDAWNWTVDLFHAKGENERLQREVEQLRGAVADKLATDAENEELRGLLDIRQSPIYPDKAGLVPARVIARSTTVWYSTVTIDAGRDEGVQVYDAVVNGQGLVGRIESVKATTSQVQLITDQQSYVDAMVLPGRAQGVLAGSVTGDLSLQYVDKAEEVKAGQYIVTSGMAGSVLTRGIPIGQVASVSNQEVELYQAITIQPFVDLRKLDLVYAVKR